MDKVIICPLEEANRVFNSDDLHFNPFAKGSKESVIYCDELLRLTSKKVSGK